MEIGKAIGLLIKKRGFNQKKVAKLVGLSQNSLSQIVNGRFNPTQQNLDKICEVLNVPKPILYFFMITEDDIPKDKLEIYKMLEPSIKHFIIQIFGEDSLIIKTKKNGK